MLIFLNHLKFQIVKIDSFHEAVLVKACFGMALELRDIFVQPDGVPQIKLAADLLQCPKDLVSAGILLSVFYDRIT